MARNIKVKINDRSKEVLYAYQLEIAKRIVDECNSCDGYLTMDDLKSAARCVGFVDGEILKQNAIVARNKRVWQAYNEESEDLDVWIEFYAYDWYNGFFEIGVYLTDIWEINGDNKEDIASRMYVRHYVYKKGE